VPNYIQDGDEDEKGNILMYWGFDGVRIEWYLKYSL
jgi:hypothetical protein